MDLMVRVGELNFFSFTTPDPLSTFSTLLLCPALTFWTESYETHNSLDLWLLMRCDKRAAQQEICEGKES